MKIRVALAAAGLSLVSSLAQASDFWYEYAEASYDWINLRDAGELEARGGTLDYSHVLWPNLLFGAHYGYSRTDDFTVASQTGHIDTNNVRAGLSYVFGVLPAQGAFDGLDVQPLAAYEYLDNWPRGDFAGEPGEYGSGYRLGAHARSGLSQRFELEPGIAYVHVKGNYGWEYSAQLRACLARHVWIVGGYTHSQPDFFWNAGVRVDIWSASAD